MAYNITKPNIYFSGDKNVLNENITGDKSKFNIKMTHAKDDMYCVITDSTKDVIEMSIEPSAFIDNSVLTNYILFNGDFSEKTILFVTSDGYEIYYSGDYTRAKYTENTIIAIQQISSNKIVICLEEGKKEYKYGVLLTLETTSPNETVYYTDPADNVDLSNVKMYWGYNPETGELGSETHDNSKVYSDAGEHYLVLMSDNDLKFPDHLSVRVLYNDISNHLIKIEKYKNYKPVLAKEGYGWYFKNYKKLQKIVTGIFDQNITDFESCFYKCSSLTSIPDGLFDNNTAVTNFRSCFGDCSSITSAVPELWNTTKWPNVTEKSLCFSGCTKAANYPEIPDDWK